MLHAMLMMFQPAAGDDTQTVVLKLLGSYGGLSILVSMALSGIKSMWKTWVAGKEEYLALALTFVFGIAAKLVVAGAYGPNTITGWVTHVIALVGCTMGAGAFHDYITNTVNGKNAAPPTAQK